LNTLCECVCVFMQRVISGTSHIKASITIAIAHPMCYYFGLGICGMVSNKITFKPSTINS